MADVELEALSAWVYEGGTGAGWGWGNGKEGGGEDWRGVGGWSST